MPIQENGDMGKLKWQYKVRNMPKKRLPAIVYRAVWAKVSKGRAGIRWGSVVDKVWKDIGGNQGRHYVRREVWEVQDRTGRKGRNKGRASAQKQSEIGETLEDTRGPSSIGMKTYLNGPVDFAKMLKLRFRVGNLDLPEERKCIPVVGRRK